jgi:hypothetical protein
MSARISLNAEQQALLEEFLVEFHTLKDQLIKQMRESISEHHKQVITVSSSPNTPNNHSIKPHGPTHYRSARTTTTAKSNMFGQVCM